MTEDSRPGRRSRLAAFRLDLTPLPTSRDIRLLFVAESVFYLGFMVGYVTVPWQLYALTGRTLWSACSVWSRSSR